MVVINFYYRLSTLGQMVDSMAKIRLDLSMLWILSRSTSSVWNYCFDKLVVTCWKSSNDIVHCMLSAPDVVKFPIASRIVHNVTSHGTSICLVLSCCSIAGIVNITVHMLYKVSFVGFSLPIDLTDERNGSPITNSPSLGSS